MTFRGLTCWMFVLGLACTPRTEAGTLASALDRQLSENARKHGIAGQAVLILHDGKLVYRGSHGVADRNTGEPVRPDHLFPVFSVSKLFASALLFELVERGELDLDQSVHRYLPDVPERWRTIKVNDFLNHTSGVPEYFEGELASSVIPATQQAAFQALIGKPLLFPTGTDTRYTQTNFLVIEAILEHRYKMPYRQIVTSRIVEPLGLHNTYFGKAHAPESRLVKSYRGQNDQLTTDIIVKWPEYSIVHAELYTTLDDLGTFLNAVANGRLVKRETLLRLWKPYPYRTGGVGYFASGWEYGRSGRYNNVGHDGGTKVRVRLLFDASLDHDTYVFVYLTNGSATNVWSRTLVDSLTGVLRRHGHSL